MEQQTLAAAEAERVHLQAALAVPASSSSVTRWLREVRDA
jgi:hypothetical protein